ncbi:hypothetical protein FAF44_09375 [Nonomuraea sp. MG754425]|uniref:hypothetical protein n=1 Tax=Nonomuraea sp. MG754425 TaxID=2570319 RepID=UPI001F1C52DF|nr:hypothetical protein [Nonomuraea sp. MG754425]MCF6468594.1 hypothetical protein [Nonomuraea sp. MG754425]
MTSSFDPAPYEAAGIPAAEGRRWWTWRLTPGQATAWRRAGVTDPAEAVQWGTAHVVPDEIAACRAARLTAAEALLWHEYEFGLADALALRRQGHTPERAHDLRHGRPPRDADDPTAPGDAFTSLMAFAGGGDPRDRTQRFIARLGNTDALVIYSYCGQDWVDDEAAAWARRNVDAPTARMWRELGLRPAEADRHIRRGLTPMAVARAWWRAGIPFEETASWAGAGLTPEEAVAQRAMGVTAEQAETLRALRDDHPR